jgi:hypothetical protein
MTEPTVLSTGGISRYREGLRGALRILSPRCGGGAGVGGFGMMLKLGYIAISGAEGFPLPRGL